MAILETIHEKIKHFFILTIFSSISLGADTSFGSLFQKNETLQLSLSYDIKELQENKQKYQESGVHGAMTSNGQSLNVEILSRGSGSLACQQPQLKIDFKGAAPTGSEFEGFKKIRLFTQGKCLKNKTDGEIDKSIMANYLQYRLLELITPYHFKTRLVEISYTDDSNTFVPYKQLAFFLEPDDHLETRLAIKDITPKEFKILDQEVIDNFDPDIKSLAIAFEFLIGNLDFSLPGGYNSYSDQTIRTFKNVKVYQDKQGNVYPLAYDFDFSRFNYDGDSIGWACVGSNEPSITICNGEEIFSAFKNQLNTLKFFRIDTIKNASILLSALKGWTVIYREQLEILGAKYENDIQLIIQNFKNALELK